MVFNGRPYVSRVCGRSIAESPHDNGGNVRFGRATVVAAGVAMVWAAAGLARELEVTSAWPQAAVRVDGTGDQWGGHLLPLPDQPMLLGVQNDGKFLYLCLKTSDPKVKAQIRRMGMTVWVNGAGKDKRAYGVRFPVGMGLERMRGEGGGPRSTPSEGTAPDALPDTTQLELIGPTDEDRLRVDRTSAEPVEAAFGDEEGVWVIELRFPLAPTDEHPLAVSAVPGATIALGLETERPKFRRGEQGGSGESGEGGEGGEGGGRGEGGRGGGMGPGGWGGGIGGRAGRYGGGMGSEMGRRGYEMPTPIKVWTLVKLASGPAAPPLAK
jgi:uncharacterized membrane protein YgcG